MNAGIHLAANVIIRLQKDLEEAREILFREERGSFREAGPLIGCSGDEIGICAADASD